MYRWAPLQGFIHNNRRRRRKKKKNHQYLLLAATMYIVVVRELGLKSQPSEKIIYRCRKIVKIKRVCFTLSLALHTHTRM